MNNIITLPPYYYDIIVGLILSDAWLHKGRSHGLIICTDSYKVEDVAKLMNVLKIRYNIDCILRFNSPTQPRITIRAKSMEILRKIVIPYMHDSMLYKLGLKNHK